MTDAKIIWHRRNPGLAFVGHVHLLSRMIKRCSILLLAMFALGALFAGCATSSNTVGNTVPWARSSYESGIPGMGGLTGGSSGPTGGNGLR